MKREIKFRAWDKEGKKMLAQHGNWNFDDEYSDLCFHFPDLPSAGKQERYEIMQFTGLKDKNGKEIYEGDLLREKGVKKPLLVQFDIESAGFFVNIPMGKAVHWAAVSHIREAELIGNIYENPQLLEA